MAEPAMKRDLRHVSSIRPVERLFRTMPIKIPDNLPARATLEKEGVAIMGEADAIRQDIRPMRIGLLNLMPNKVRTETQFARLLGCSPLQVELTLVKLTNHVSRNTPADHMISFYRAWEDVRHEKFDGFIITGAPVETIPFEQVTYWDELRRILDWTQTHVHHSLHVCWGAMAAVYHFHGIGKHLLNEKRFGVYRHRNLMPDSPYLRGFSDDFSVPVSRWSEARREDIPAGSGIRVLMDSDEAGLCLLDDPATRALHMFNHIEYDAQSLSEEYFRDLEANRPIAAPHNYFPGDDPAHPPLNRWRSHAYLLFGNWINQLYQTTPFDLREIGQERAALS